MHSTFSPILRQTIPVDDYFTSMTTKDDFGRFLYGGAIELSALAQMCNVTIYVFKPYETSLYILDSTFDSTPGQQKEMIFLHYWNRHYDVFKPETTDYNTVKWNTKQHQISPVSDQSDQQQFISGLTQSTYPADHFSSSLDCPTNYPQFSVGDVVSASFVGSQRSGMHFVHYSLFDCIVHFIQYCYTSR